MTSSTPFWKTGLVWHKLVTDAEHGRVSEEDKAKFEAWLREACEAEVKTPGVPTKCWIFKMGRTYPRIMTREGDVRRQVFLHRLVCEAEHGPLGKEAAHHTCGNSMCVNPAHIIPVTQAANVAESLARNALTRRVAELESRLAEVSPNDPVLNRATLEAEDVKPTPTPVVEDSDTKEKVETTPLFVAVFGMDVANKQLRLLDRQEVSILPMSGLTVPIAFDTSSPTLDTNAVTEDNGYRS